MYQMTTIPTTPRASHAPTNLNPPRFSKSNGHHTLKSPIKISHLSQSFSLTHSPNPTFSFSFPSSFCAKSLTMLLKAAVNANASLFNSENTRLVPLLQRGSKLDRISVSATKGSNNNRVLTGVLFEPFEEVKKELDLVPIVPQDSLARHKFHVDSESAINEQINVEYNVSYVYHAMYAYFDRDNVALKGLAKFFKESSEEERGHAEKLMEYQNKRGGKVKLQSIVMPLSEFDHADKGDALHAMELALSLEKLTNEKLLNLHNVASKNGDVNLADFVESEFLGEQVEAIKKISEYVAQLRRVGKGHGVWHFDQMLLNEAAAA